MVVDYYSKTFVAAEKNYCIIRKELAPSSSQGGQALLAISVWESVQITNRSYITDMAVQTC